MTAFATLPLLALALLSPTLTLVRLFQQKEWRLDRLREHLTKEGWASQLFGTTRPALGILWIIALVIIVALGMMQSFDTACTLALLTALALLGFMQVGIGRQRMPVWTQKALIVTILAIALPVALGFGMLLKPSSITTIATGITALTPPLWVFIAWAVFLPIDTVMKSRIIARAESARLSHPNLRVIGITGSVGKTTMKALLLHVLKEKGAIATPDRVNSEIGVARWFTKLLATEPATSDRIVIVEMGAYRVGEIALLCRMTKPVIGVITVVGTQHLSLFGGKDRILHAKGELFDALPKTGMAFTSTDQEAFEALKKRAPCEVTGVGTDHRAEVRITDIEETGEGVRFRAFDTDIRSGLAGTHSVTGIAIAIAVAAKLGVRPQQSARLLPTFRRMQSTFEVKNMNGVSVLDDSYNSSPESVSAAIRWAATRPEKNKILLLEGIIELGDQEELIHRELAELAAPVFTTVYTAHTRTYTYVRDILGSRVHEAVMAGPAPEGSLVVICGRVSPLVIRRLLPAS